MLYPYSAAQVVGTGYAVSNLMRIVRRLKAF